jgi:hypothetical protein
MGTPAMYCLPPKFPGNDKYLYLGGDDFTAADDLWLGAHEQRLARQGAGYDANAEEEVR